MSNHSLGKAEPGDDIGVVDVDVDHLLGPLHQLLVVGEEDWWRREGDTLDCCPGWQQGWIFHKLDGSSRKSVKSREVEPAGQGC